MIADSMESFWFIRVIKMMSYNLILFIGRYENFSLFPLILVTHVWSFFVDLDIIICII